MAKKTEGAVLVRLLGRNDCKAAGKFCEKTLKWMQEKYLHGVYPEEGLRFDIWHHSAQNILKDLSDPDRFTLLAVKGEDICGIARGTVFGASGQAVLNYIAVDPDRQHEGIGMKLMIACEDLLAKRRCHKISLHTLPALIPAVRLYMKFGLLPEAYLRKAWWGADFLLMSKWIGDYKKTAEKKR
jgi:ribosomal protein S18 acetylase RimI-like enzyme